MLNNKKVESETLSREEKEKNERKDKMKKDKKELLSRATILLIVIGNIMAIFGAVFLLSRALNRTEHTLSRNTPVEEVKAVEEQMDITEDDQKWLDTLAGSKDIATVDHEIREFTLQLTSKELNIRKIKELDLDIVNEDFKNIYRDLRNSYAQQSLLISLAYPDYSFTVKDVEGETMGTFYEGEVIYDAFPLVR